MKITLPISIKFAIRSLARNSRRSVLSIVGVAVGCSVALSSVSIAKGKIDLFIRNIAEGGVGHFRVTPRGWEISHDSALRLADWQKDLTLLRSTPGVKVATPRARLQAMLAMGTHMSGVEMVGVDPETEPATLRYVRQVESGRYLQPQDSHSMVIGRAIAERLKVEVGDSVVVTVVGSGGEMKSEMFNVLGILNLGTKQLEASICQVNLKDLESLSGLAGAGEIAVILDEPALLKQVMERVKPSLASGDTLMSWGEIRPDGKMAVYLNEVMANIFTFILVFVAFVGVASAQLTAILERQKEFAVLSAIGMGSKRIVGLVLSEAAVLGTLSWCVTLLMSGPLLSHFAKVGIRVLSKSQSFSALGTVIDPIFHLSFGSWFFAYSAFLCYFSTIAASIYPAFITTRLNPADALRVAQ